MVVFYDIFHSINIAYAAKPMDRFFFSTLVVTLLVLLRVNLNTSLLDASIV